MKKKITTIGLSDTQFATLSALATEHKTLSRHGATTGEPSWRCLVAAIGDGTLVVSAPGAKGERREKKRKKPFKAHTQFPPRWWKPSPMDDMTTPEAVAASGMTFEVLVAGGLTHLPDGSKLLPPRDASMKWYSEEGME
jgi:hypothetical protein